MTIFEVKVLPQELALKTSTLRVTFHGSGWHRHHLFGLWEHGHPKKKRGAVCHPRWPMNFCQGVYIALRVEAIALRLEAIAIIPKLGWSSRPINGGLKRSLDVDEGILAARPLQQFQGLLKIQAV